MLEKAEEYGCKREKSDPPEADVDLVLPTMEISVGDDFELSLEFVNRSDQQRTVDAYISGNMVYYTGVTSSEFLFKTPSVTIEPNSSESSTSGIWESWNYLADALGRICCGYKRKRFMHFLTSCSCEGVGGRRVKEVHEASGGTGQPSLHLYWEGRGDRPDCHHHESGHPAQPQSHG